MQNLLNLKRLRSLWRDADLSDVRILALGKEYNLHKAILVQSPFFDAAFSSRWRKDGTEPFRLEMDESEYSVNSMESVLKTMYGHELAAIGTFQDGQELCAAASFLQLSHVEDEVAHRMRQLVTLDAAVHFFQYAEKRENRPSLEAVRKECERLIWTRGQTRPDLLASLPDLNSFLSSDKFMVDGGEYERFKLIEEIAKEKKKMMTEENGGERPAKRLKQGRESTSNLRSVGCRLEFLSMEQLEPLRGLQDPDIIEALWTRCAIQSALEVPTPKAADHKGLRYYRFCAKLSRGAYSNLTQSQEFDAYGSRWKIEIHWPGQFILTRIRGTTDKVGSRQFKIKMTGHGIAHHPTDAKQRSFLTFMFEQAVWECPLGGISVVYQSAQAREIPSCVSCDIFVSISIMPHLM
mmetsp:Transcript_18221/g.29938  ORF Transcript_18221/g.29938 Transcript_18221/m.29938 type:complete len:407 (+) Transcript_18221:61-1281(+)|eukprot:CAMPEP_0184349272 /NCGR_PEP_ID=MMETSP1089-20130417/32281_1 /TAXON_ID=38269 ORGANISM="Gloeochaete wittrockiana, Strain SAG46.84" /NCGR_SAMPLE_ID=MMETSP1089 /ASSEMBLY_ACC=CAM_ASM_000445 /LENGTH=406 /DNA_ID=CAMNT_0026681389 /DNA_START=66 /DNA_END=1286 /DNA_ORIENTATION=-